MSWFSNITGFAEGSYDGTKSRLSVRDGRLHSTKTTKSHGIGTFELVSLADLRRAPTTERSPQGLTLSLVRADVRDLIGSADNAGALFQVASQFNMLEMTSPAVIPEDGVTRYAWDHTQGPACAIATGAATIYRNYLIPIGDQTGQTADLQLDGLADMGAALSALTGLPVHELWLMENGYALGRERGLRVANAILAETSSQKIDDIRACLKIGLLTDAEVTEDGIETGQRVSQVFCSAMPASYSGGALDVLEPLSRLVLEAAYEATLYCAERNRRLTASRKVFLTLLGAGAFGNPPSWVLAAMHRAVDRFRNSDLDVYVVSHGEAHPDLQQLVADFDAGQPTKQKPTGSAT